MKIGRLAGHRDLARAGGDAWFNDLKQVSYARILKELTPDNLKDLPDINVSILRNITVEAIEPYLRYYCYDEGLQTGLPVW